MTTFAKYSAGAASGGGVVPRAYTTQEQRPLPPVKTLFPPPDALNWWLEDGTPVVSSNQSLFYYLEDDGGLDKECPSCDLAQRVRSIAARGNQFVLAYGGLGWAEVPFFDLMRNTSTLLAADEIVVVGAQELARLATDAGQARAPERQA